ncbi:YqaA family protein [Veronia pacifica]|uniref:VTT domain-containing protein n=1 Tax=Veronia pacifica TaxID=1080227 RepID=A0A1C3EB73_9GAMM|nr:YqaA family protein [Veronia pacifica]ODA30507.1 hypothetical protein A8L45_20145 [Veronia pacifica]
MFDWFAGDHALWVLFSTGFLSSTLLPGGSEANLIFLLNQQHYPVVWLLVVATLGNTLGGMTNYWIGRFIPQRKKSEKQQQRALVWLSRYGYPVLLLSWMPVIGDPLCLAAGWLRLRQSWCWLLVAIGKALRYVVISVVTLGLIH